jgi:hypothetical protein
LPRLRRHDRRHRDEHHRHQPADQVVERRRRAAIGHLGGAEAHACRQVLHDQVGVGADPGGSVRERRVGGAGAGDELGRGGDARVRGCEQRHRAVHELHHWQQVGHRIGGEAAAERLCEGGLPGGGEQQGVPIRRRAGHGLGAHGAARAAAVLDHDLLADDLPQRLGEQSPRHIL